MATDTRIIDLIDRLERAPRLDELFVGQVFGASLQHANDAGNPYIDVFVATVAEPSLVQKLELRVPADGTRPGQALLILKLRPNAPLPIGALRSRFPAPAHIQQPLAAAPHGTPTYEVHDLPWGRLSLGYLPAENDAVREIVIDRKAAATSNPAAR